MKAVIFAGGLGTRLSEETALRPKPMVEVGGKPMLWHVMKVYAQHGITDFVVLGGYRVDVIRDYLLNYVHRSSDFTINLGTGEIVNHSGPKEDWRVTVLDTGLETMTGGRLKRARNIIGDEAFCLTYGDGVSDVNITDLIAFHRAQKKMATVTAVAPPGRFGVLGFEPDGATVGSFREKASADVGLINAGFFVCEPQVFDLIDEDATVWEQEPMKRLVDRKQLAAFKHTGFWQSMDTVRDRAVLEAAYANGAPWLKA